MSREENNGDLTPDSCSDRPGQATDINGLNVWNLMLLVLAFALWMGLVRRHLEDETLKFRFASGAPVSVKSRLYLGHLMTSCGFVYGGCQLLRLSFRNESARVAFGSFGWSICGFYLFFQIFSSFIWSCIHQVFRNGSQAGLGPFSVVERVVLLSSHQACFDEFAWLLAAFWSAAWLVGNKELGEQLPSGMIVKMQSSRSDISFAFYTSFVVLVTIFQRVFEAIGM